MKSYLKDTSGNIAMMFGIGCMVLLMGVGTALDYSALTSRAKSLQDYTDAAVLAAASSKENDVAALTKIVNDTLKLHNDNGWTITSTVSVNEDDIITVATETVYDTMLMGIFGHDKMPIGIESAAPFGASTPLNIAFVLDSTFSMRGGNLSDLQTAAGGLIDKLDDLDNEKIRMSVVPFSEYVNVGVSNRNEPWINVALDSKTTGPETCRMVTPTTTTCTGTETVNSSRDGIDYSYERNTGCTSTPTGAPDYQSCSSPTLEETKWNGCAGSRRAPKNTRAGVDGIGNRIPGISYINPAPSGHFNPSCGTEMLPLTASYSDVKSKINSMTPNGMTYIPTGLMWGWRTLTPEAPFPAGSAATSKPDEPAINAIVLMSDGANTVRKEDVYHIEDKADDAVAGVGLEANALTAETCEAIKDDGIIIYTVSYNFPSDPSGTKAILEACATSSGDYFDANDAAELSAAFDRIGNSIFSVRLSR